ncbi:MAG: hypothetical protein KDE68_02380 [Rhodocyclaceae bacterium]|nr:hypothetical protein [Rhodocyclaceae bacterium]
MTIRTPIKDALRASIENEDAALEKRKPVRASKRRASVKASALAVQRMAAPARKGPAETGKPLDALIAASEDAALKRVRDSLRATGRTLNKRDLVRVAIGLLEAVDRDDLALRLDVLPDIIEDK